MMIDSWNEAFKTDIAVVDEQHKEMFRIFRSIQQVVLTACTQYTYEDLLKIVCETRDYITYHFYTEEEYMLKMNYPDYEAHKALHEIFKAQVGAIKNSQLINAPLQTMKKLQEIMGDFIMEHMIVEDKKMADYYAANFTVS